MKLKAQSLQSLPAPARQSWGVVTLIDIGPPQGTGFAVKGQTTALR